MHDNATRSVLILSESDADAIAQGVSDLMELIWDIFGRRRVQLPGPTDDPPHRVGVDSQTGTNQSLMEIF